DFSHSRLDKIVENSPYLVYDNSGRNKELLEIAEGVTLTIESGVIVKFKNPGLNILGTIKAEGDSERPIIFTSYRDDEYGGDIWGGESDFEHCQENPDDIYKCPQAGHWSGMLIASSSTNSVFDSVIIRYAGNKFSSTPAEAAIKVKNSSITLKNSIIEHNTSKGVWLVNSPDSIIENSIFQNHLKHNKSYSTMAKKKGLRNIAIYLDSSSPQIENSIFQNNLTGIYINNNSEPIIKNNVFSNNYYPIWFYNSYPQFSGNQMTDNKKYNGIVIKSLKLTDRNYTLGADSVLINYEKHPKDSITVSEDYILTIKPGTIIKSRKGTSGFLIEGTLIADGTSDNQIIFTSIHDDRFGGDTNSDGDKTEYCQNRDPEDKSYPNCPRAGMWGQIIFEPSSKNSFLNHVVIKCAGRKWMESPNHSKKDYVLKIEGSDLVLKNSIIGNNSHGLYMKDSKNSQIANTVFEGSKPKEVNPFTSTGIHLISSTPTIDSTTFLNNKLGIYISIDSIPTLLNLFFGEGKNETDIEDLRPEEEEQCEKEEVPIEIINIFYDGEEENEADEYVKIKNNGETAVNLENWTLADEAGHVYTFESYDLEARESIKVYTNMGEFSYGTGRAIWNNDGDTAYLKDCNGDLIDSYNY
ncbi:MAG: lamin tail domain-containing protein, partial [Atribacterota bacterium]